MVRRTDARHGLHIAEMTREEFAQQVVKEHQQAIGNFCRGRLRNYHDALDVLQVTFLRAWDRRRSYDPSKAGLKTWLFCIAVNECTNHGRRRSSRIIRDTTYGELQKGFVAPDKTLEDREEVEFYLDKLEEQTRDAYVLRHKCDLSYPVISGILGISPAGVKKLLHAAVVALGIARRARGRP